MIKILLLTSILFVGNFCILACNESKSENTKNMAKPIELTKAQFLSRIANYESNSREWKYLGDKPAIVDFWAPWCGPCRVIAPTLEELANEYQGEIYIYKINVDNEPELASAFGITSIPTLFFIPMNGTPQMAQGALPKATLKDAIEKVLLKK